LGNPLNQRENEWRRSGPRGKTGIDRPKAKAESSLTVMTERSQGDRIPCDSWRKFENTQPPISVIQISENSIKKKFPR
jgi:hypothetical protein